MDPAMSRWGSLVAVALLIASIWGCGREGPKEPPKAEAPVPAGSGSAPAATGLSAYAIFRSVITVDRPLRDLVARQTAIVPVKVKNTSTEVWPWSPASGDPTGTVRLGYHWLGKAQGGVVVWDGLRTPLPKALGPGETVSVAANVKAPDTKGVYILAFDLVVDGPGGSWFSAKAVSMTSVEILVK